MATSLPSTSRSPLGPTSPHSCKGSRATPAKRHTGATSSPERSSSPTPTPTTHPAPHWGYVIAGALVVTYTDADDAPRCNAGDCFYWPAGHRVRVEKDAEVILVSPHGAHAAVIDHMKAKLAAMT